MTNSEAIKMLKSKMDGSVDTSYEWCECVRLAIIALEEQESPNSIRINFVGEEVRNNTRVNICGIPHKVVECEDKFDTDCHFGQIDYKACEIRINKDISPASKKETLCHEMLHGMLVHLGYAEASQDEQFVQALGNAIYQSFEIKAESEE